MSDKNPARLRTLAQARRAPQWRRFIDSLHAAQERAGFDGRQFGAGEMHHFGELLVGLPQEAPYGAAIYWAARQVNEHSDGSQSVRYVLKVWRPAESAHVDTVADEYLPEGFTPADDAAMALDYARRAAFQIGGTL